jgi:hypothetical protein
MRFPRIFRAAAAMPLMLGACIGCRCQAINGKIDLPRRLCASPSMPTGTREDYVRGSLPEQIERFIFKVVLKEEQ